MCLCHFYKLFKVFPKLGGDSASYFISLSSSPFFIPKSVYLITIFCLCDNKTDSLRSMKCWCLASSVCSERLATTIIEHSEKWINVICTLVCRNHFPFLCCKCNTTSLNLLKIGCFKRRSKLSKGVSLVYQTCKYTCLKSAIIFIFHT